jgi:hypothetical protein
MRLGSAELEPGTQRLNLKVRQRPGVVRRNYIQHPLGSQNQRVLKTAYSHKKIVRKKRERKTGSHAVFPPVDDLIKRQKMLNASCIEVL